MKMTFVPMSSRACVGIKDCLSCGEIETSRRISLVMLTNHVKTSSGNSGGDELDFFVFFKGELSTGFMSLLHFASSKVAP